MVPVLSRRNQRYTQQEEAVILKNIQENPGNLYASFEVSATQLGRDPKSVSVYYYNVMRKKLEDAGTPAIAVASPEVAMLGKNAVRKQIVPNARTVRQAMAHAAFTTLSKEQILQFFLSKLSDKELETLLIGIIKKTEAKE